jgi:hypothetical protein
MSLPLRAIETSGTLDEFNHLRLDSSLPIKTPRRVRVIVFFPKRWMIGMKQNG